MKVRLPIFSLSITLLLLLAGCSTLSAEPVTARVVDADTGEPLAGVVVVAFWDLHQGSLYGHAPSCGAANIEEAVTDENGQFRITGWGPITSTCDMREFNPNLTLFKAGYHPLGLNNASLADPTGTVSVSRSIWNGKDISLRKFPSTDLRRNENYSEFDGLNRILGMYVFAACDWKKIPDMLRAIYLQQQEFTAAGRETDNSITTNMIENDARMQKAAPQCGSPKAFIEELA